jgi:hypothetical protein
VLVAIRPEDAFAILPKWFLPTQGLDINGNPPSLVVDNNDCSIFWSCQASPISFSQCPKTTKDGNCPSGMTSYLSYDANALTCNYIPDGQAPCCSTPLISEIVIPTAPVTGQAAILSINLGTQFFYYKWIKQADSASPWTTTAHPFECTQFYQVGGDSNVMNYDNPIACGSGYFTGGWWCSDQDPNTISSVCPAYSYELTVPTLPYTFDVADNTGVLCDSPSDEGTFKSEPSSGANIKVSLCAQGAKLFFRCSIASYGV